jgi:hypothetical protein
MSNKGIWSVQCLYWNEQSDRIEYWFSLLLFRSVQIFQNRLVVEFEQNQDGITLLLQSLSKRIFKVVAITTGAVEACSG